MPRRSRGCQQCRQRRIGCDLSLPSCRQCVITNRTCSGARRDNLFIINQTKAVSSRYSQTESPPTIDPNVRLIQQPSHRTVLFSTFVSHFISFLTVKSGGPAKWQLFSGMHEVIAEDVDATLELSLQAVATVYCGMDAQNSSTIMEAVRMYGRAVSRQHLAIGRADVPTTTTICTTVLLSLFETICPTNTGAYAAHLLAARKMLGLARTELARSEFLRQVGVHIQYQTLFTLVADPVLAYGAGYELESWNNLCWFQLKENPQVADRVMDQLFFLAEIFDKRRRNSKISADTTMTRLSSIGSTIDELWADFQRESAINHSSFTYDEGELHNGDVMTALTVAYFMTARLLLSLLRAPNLFDRSAHLKEHGEGILRCSSFLATQEIGCASLRMIFPLTLVAVYSSSSEQRLTAKDLLETWLQIYSFRGLCSMIHLDDQTDSSSDLDKEIST